MTTSRMRAAPIGLCASVALAVGLLAAWARGEEAGARPQPPPAADATLAGPAAGDWVRIKAGTFAMGSPPGEPDRHREEVQHQVTLTRDFLILATETTQRQFSDAMGYNPSYDPGCGPDCPVNRVSWHEAAAYCNRLSEREGLPACYTCRGSFVTVSCRRSKQYASPYDCAGYRLPTEAEWEYAARAGTTGPRYGELDAIAWWDANSGYALHPARQKQPNAWGLFDMFGNVEEWCNDWFGYQGYSAAPATDPPGRRAGAQRVARGSTAGCDFAGFIRAAHRSAAPPDFRAGFVGFRPARMVSP